MKKFLIFALVLAMCAAVAAYAKDAGGLVTDLNNQGFGDVDQKLAAAENPDETVAVTGTVDGATQQVVLNINQEVTIEWGADFESTVADPDNAIELTGSGIFELVNGKTTTADDAAIVINAANTVTVKLSGGEIESTGGIPLKASKIIVAADTDLADFLDESGPPDTTLTHLTVEENITVILSSNIDITNLILGDGSTLDLSSANDFDMGTVTLGEGVTVKIPAGATDEDIADVAEGLYETSGGNVPDDLIVLSGGDDVSDAVQAKVAELRGESESSGCNGGFGAGALLLAAFALLKRR